MRLRRANHSSINIRCDDKTRSGRLDLTHLNDVKHRPRANDRTLADRFSKYPYTLQHLRLITTQRYLEDSNTGIDESAANLGGA